MALAVSVNQRQMVNKFTQAGNGAEMARRRLDADQSKTLILDAVEELMRREGFAAVNTRSVAHEAGMKPPLVHYHFETTENLLLAAYRRSAARSEFLLDEALRSRRPLRALWQYTSDPQRSALATQFMALAGEKPAIREEMASNVENFRLRQTQALAAQAAAAPRALGITPEILAILIAALGRALVMETSIGVTSGHVATRELVERLIQQLEPDEPSKSPARA